MASLIITDKILAVTCGSHVLGVRMYEELLEDLEVPGLEDTKGIGTLEQVSGIERARACVVGADLSRCSRWLAVSSSNKQLNLWETTNWSLVSNRSLARSAEKVKFTPNSTAVVVADRSGDAYLFSVLEPHKEGKLLLGHLSMLLDILVTDDEEFVITCDRDEKIRVSCYPNAYNIQSYCLGHTEFVSCLSFLSHLPSILVSGSGDGTLRFWDYTSGTQEVLTNCSKEVKEREKCNSISKDVESSLGEELAVTHVTNCLESTSSSTVVACVAGHRGCIVYTVTGEKHSMTCSFRQIVEFASVPWDIHVSGTGLLWHVVNSESEPLGVLWLDSDHSVDNSDLQSKTRQVIAVINKKRKYFTQLQPPELTNILYKRKFDNVQEYFEKKKARLASVVL